MIRLFAFFAGIFLLAAPVTSLAGSPRPDAPPAPTVRVGSVAPDFTLKTFSGEEITLTDLRGKVVVINFWATWCPPCREEMPSMERLYQRMQGKPFEMLAINVEEDARQVLGTFLQKTPHSFPIPLDTNRQAQELYRVYRFPETFIADPNGIVVNHIIGARDWATSDTIDYFNSLMTP